MGSTNTNTNRTDLLVSDPAFSHFGRLGMKWGVRHTPAELAATPHEDAQRHLDAQKKISSGGAHALSDKELKQLVNRIQMQKQYSDLLAQQKPKAAVNRGHDAVKNILGFAVTGVAIYNLANSPAAKAGLRILKEATKTAGKHVATKTAASTATSAALALVR